MKHTSQESNSIEVKELSQQKTTSSKLAFPLPSSALFSLSTTYKLPVSSPLPGGTAVRGSGTHRYQSQPSFLSPGGDLPFQQGQSQGVASWV